ncbi:MAG: class I SAM-dependent rRNA methyltransferase, partial [Syntrophales bacterium]|nr:class I SAM-dependent rRNA methyltransferase [Syntrophales bacterium]
MGRPYPQIILKAGRERSLLRGHPWIFSGALASVQGNPEPGQIVCALSGDRKPLALGFFNPESDIAFRAVTADTDAVINIDFWRRRLLSALALRRRIIPPETTAYRIINAEGDGMPGLVADRYGEYLVVSVNTAGIERYRDEILDVMINDFRPAYIYERSEGPARRTEGLADRSGVFFGTEMPPTAEIVENGLRFQVDVVSGQKTGFFLDQRDSRMLIGSLGHGAHVLNCFSYTGAFSVYAARGGARRVVSVEASASANEAAAAHLVMNGLSPDDH